MTQFNWSALMKAGMRGAGLKPDEFWQLTPAELMIILGQDKGSAPLSRARLEELARAFPDSTEEPEHGGL
ncbi:rcc01693 family protein [Cochlodiniinecator piscidefendens]|uniref:rcc01693 family protein n=1 Tax=Cochlodiniinecator piscidefendens TaxID=2715756 RepID=UPI00140E3F0C